MKAKGVIIVGIMMLTLFVVNYSEAVEVQLTGQDTVEAEAVKKIELYLKNSSFPDSAYTVEIDKNITVSEDGLRVKLKIKVLPKTGFFDSFRNVIEQALGYEWMSEPWIGIKVGGPSYSMDREKSDRIIDIDEESPAIKAGLRKGAKILSYNGKVADGPKALEELVANSKVGEVITLYVETPKDYQNFPVTVSEKRILKRKNAEYNKNDKILKIAGHEYKMSHSTFESIMKLFNREYFKLGFPLVIRYELKNSSGKIMQLSEKEFKAFYRGSDYIDIDFDKIYAAGIGFREVIDLKGAEDIIGITVSPKQVKEIVASVVTKQKEREEEQERLEAQRKKEEGQKKEKVEQKEREDKRKKQQKIASEKRKAERERLLPLCNNKILSHEEFILGKNPYADKGKCVEFSAATFQMTSANTGLFNIGNNELAFIEFKETFRGSGVQGIAKIKGLYNYTTRSGISNQVPHLEMLEIEKVLGR